MNVMMHAIGSANRRRAACALAIAVVLAQPTRARAQTSAQAAAEALFDEARKTMARGDLATACPKFEESQRLDPAAGTLFNLALCYERSAKLASAWVTYRATASAAEKDNRAEWAMKATKKAAQLEPRLSRLTIEVPAGVRVPGLRVERDHVEVGTSEWGTPIPVDGGTHVVVVSAPGYAARNLSADVAGERARVTVTLPALEPLPSEPKPPPADARPSGSASSSSSTSREAPAAPTDASHDGQRTLGFVLGGAGIAAIGVSGVFGLLAMNSRSDAAPDCAPDFAWCGDAGLAHIESAHSEARIATWAGVGGAVLLGAGAVLVLTSPPTHTRAAMLRLHVAGMKGGAIAGLGAALW